MSLRLRVLALVAFGNLLVFGVGLAFLARKLEEERAGLGLEFSAALADTLQASIREGEEVGAAAILRWPNWRFFEDAILLRAGFETDERGEVQPRGVVLNPLGRARRRAGFADGEVLRDVARAVRERRPAPSAGGLALPLFGPGGEVWGGAWFLVERRGDARTLALELLPWFLSSTLILTLGTFYGLRRFVLDPVRELARGAQRLSAGDLAVRLEVPSRRDEMSELVERFNGMAARVQGFNAELAREVEAATERVRRAEAAAMTQRRLAATGELAAGIAHEINNPLGGLLNAVEVLERGQQSAEKRAQYHALLRSGLERIQATVGQVLRLSPRSVRPAPLALAQPALDALALVQHRARRLGVRLEVACGPERAAYDPGPGREAVERRWRELPPVLGAANELAQAVLNLLVNALDALEERGAGTVVVALARRGDGLELSVADDGPGVREEDLPRISDLFFTTKEVGKGTGLGLALVHGVAASHGGQVELESGPGAGFRATIVLPAWKGTGAGGA